MGTLITEVGSIKEAQGHLRRSFQLLSHLAWMVTWTVTMKRLVLQNWLTLMGKSFLAELTKLSVDFDGDNFSVERIGDALLVLLIGDDGISLAFVATSLWSFCMALRICANGTVETIGLLVLGADEVLAIKRESCFFVEGSNFSMNLKITIIINISYNGSSYLLDNSGVRSLNIKKYSMQLLEFQNSHLQFLLVKTFSTAFSQIFDKLN